MANPLLPSPCHARRAAQEMQKPVEGGSWDRRNREAREDASGKVSCQIPARPQNPGPADEGGGHGFVAIWMKRGLGNGTADTLKC